MITTGDHTARILGPTGNTIGAQPLTIRCACGWESTGDPDVVLEARAGHVAAVHPGRPRRPRKGLVGWNKTSEVDRRVALITARDRATGSRAVEERKGQE